MRVVIDHRGHELAAEERPDGDWSVRLGHREAHGRYLDHALAELLGIPRAQAIAADERPSD